MSAPSHDSATGAPVAPDPAHLALDPTGFSAPPSGPEHALDPRNRRRRALGSWALYDLANTVWSFGIFSYAIGLYLTQDGVMGEAAGNLWLQIAISVSVGLNALVSPAIGAMSDRSGIGSTPTTLLSSMIANVRPSTLAALMGG